MAHVTRLTLLESPALMIALIWRPLEDTEIGRQTLWSRGKKTVNTHIYLSLKGGMNVWKWQFDTCSNVKYEKY